MIRFHYNHRYGMGRRFKKAAKQRGNLGALFVLLLCLFIEPVFLPTLIAAAQEDAAGQSISDNSLVIVDGISDNGLAIADGISDNGLVIADDISDNGLVIADTRMNFSDIVEFQSIALHYTDVYGKPEENPIGDYEMLEEDKQLALRYTYKFTGEQCKEIKADTKYYLVISPHLVLPHLESGSPLAVETEDGKKEQFGTIYADGSDAWVMFTRKEDGSGTVLSDYADSGGLEDVYFYLNCSRSGKPPLGEDPIDGNNNLYAMKFENGTEIKFGYAEYEPVTEKAQMEKSGSLADNMVTWHIEYTPWQNPSAADGVSMDSSFELRDRIDGSLHLYVDGSARIEGKEVTAYASRDLIPSDSPPETYMLIEQDGADTVLVFGGTKFDAGKATGINPAKPLEITYKTSVDKELLLPDKGGNKKITNTARLFAGDDKAFNQLDVVTQSTVEIPEPKWIKKTGETERHTDGTGATTDWAIEFYPNGFSFDSSYKLTLHDQIPDGSKLVESSVKVDGKTAAVTMDSDNGFIISPIVTTDGRPVTVTYQTRIPESMYDEGINLGSNAAWFTFRYQDTEYTTPEAVTPVGSGGGSDGPDTAPLVKTNGGYHASDRTIAWTVRINPHKAYLKGGTFVDELGAASSACNISGHDSGLQLVGDISVLVNDKTPDITDQGLISVSYDHDKRLIEIDVQEIGAKSITLNYTTKVCDPCVFANNTKLVNFINQISTDNLLIGRKAVIGRSASADSTCPVSAAVLDKWPPVYDYENGTMKWTIEVDKAELPMKDVVLKDVLPAGLAYVDKSLTVSDNPDAEASISGQELTIRLGTVNKKTTVTFKTQVDPERLGFGKDGSVVVENNIRMNGSADGIIFPEVSSGVEYRFANHGLVKSASRVDTRDGMIQYDVLINPFHLSLPGDPKIVDTLDKGLQLDTDTLRFYKASVSGNTGDAGQKPTYVTDGEGQILGAADYDPATNSYTVQLPIQAGSRDAYVLTYTADIIDLQSRNYGNSVCFEGGSVSLGGSKDNSVSVGGGGGGGGGVASRKAKITVVKTDADSQTSLAGVTFTLYQWDSVKGVRGLPFAQGITDTQGIISFFVKPGVKYELVESKSAPGYSSLFQWKQLPSGVTETDSGLLLTAGAAKSELRLELTNEAYTPTLPPDEGEVAAKPGVSGGLPGSAYPGEAAADAGTAYFDLPDSAAGQTGNEDFLLSAAGMRNVSEVWDLDYGSDWADIPRTGDSTPWLFCFFVLSGILLVFITLYQLLRRERKKKMLRLFGLLPLFFFTCSCIALVFHLAKLNDGTEFYERIWEEEGHMPAAGSSEPRGMELERSDGQAELTAKLVRFAEEYPETVAWLCIPDTSVDYPVMAGADNQFYLNHLPDGKKNALGSLFLDCRTSMDSSHLIIYGHNIWGGKMFGLLKQYESPDYFAEHKTLTVVTADSVYVCPIFSVRRVGEEDHAYRMDFQDRDDLAGYAAQAASESLYPIDADISGIKSVVTLSTCTAGSSQRLVIQAALQAE